MSEQNAEPENVDAPDMELTDSEKIDAIYSRMLQLDELLEAAGPMIAQAGPLLESAGPLLAGFGAQASSPMGRILGSIIR